MTEPFIGEIQIFGFNFAPRGFALCSGSTLAIAQNTALFALLGTTYGGNGQTTFALPNFSSRTACHRGNGPGLSPRVMGEAFGAQTVTLTSSQMPQHTHGMVLYSQNAGDKRAGSPAAGNALSVSSSASATSFRPQTAPDTTFTTDMLQSFNGSGFPHENRQPYLALNFCIALEGIFPSFN